MAAAAASQPVEPRVAQLLQLMRLAVGQPAGAQRVAALRRLAFLSPAIVNRWDQSGLVNGWTLLFDVMHELDAERGTFRDGGQTEAVQVLLDAGLAGSRALPALVTRPASRSENPHHHRLFQFLLDRTLADPGFMAPVLRQYTSPERCSDQVWRRALQQACDSPSPAFEAELGAAEKEYLAGQKRKAASQADDEAYDDDLLDVPSKKKSKGHKKSSDGGSATEEKDSDTAELRAAISSLIVPSLQVSWDSVGGLQEAKAILKETVLLPILQPQLFTGKLSAWKGILFYGPPGTGKSMLAKAVATEAKSCFFSVSASSIMSKWHGDSERLIKTLFSMAREKVPAVIFVDEIDSVLGARSDGDNETSRRMKTEFMVQMDGVGANNRGILVLAATNTPWSLDPAIRRRFQKRIYIPLPDASARLATIKLQIGSDAHKLTDADLHWLAEQTDGFSGDDIATLFKEALYAPLRLTRDSSHFKKVPGPGAGADDGVWEPCAADAADAVQMSILDVPQGKLKDVDLLGRQHVKAALLKTKKSVGSEDLERYEEWTKEFGQDGAE